MPLEPSSETTLPDGGSSEQLPGQLLPQPQMDKELGTTPPKSAGPYTVASGDQATAPKLSSNEAPTETEAGQSLLDKALSTVKQGKKMDANMLGQLWEEQDANKDGKLTVDELKPLVRARVQATLLDARTNGT